MIMNTKLARVTKHLNFDIKECLTSTEQNNWLSNTKCSAMKTHTNSITQIHQVVVLSYLVSINKKGAMNLKKRMEGYIRGIAARKGRLVMMQLHFIVKILLGKSE